MIEVVIENTGNYFCQITKIKMSPAFVRPKAVVHKLSFLICLSLCQDCGRPCWRAECGSVMPFGKMQHTVIKLPGKEMENYQAFLVRIRFYSFTGVFSMSMEFLIKLITASPSSFTSNNQIYKHFFSNLDYTIWVAEKKKKKAITKCQSFSVALDIA